MQTGTLQLSTKDLRNFGLIMGALFALIFGLLLPWLWGQVIPTWPWVVAGLFGTCALVRPKSLMPVYRIWMRIATVLGWINTRIILGLVFYLFLLPTGTLMRLLGKDPMARQFDPTAESYRINRTSSSRNSMERPF